ncbi:hypothetical protein [Sulfitobacter sp. S190]|uniref:hypothetical protein n=1 Tax=Sulfitobacter sp. S190 TaxID=2867022 RepID=UPI0021A49A7F|nr:hypothetical protein [Sulfitobacter sp. S190]UWR21442.1 hypothetical protein K3756_12100 [Sulfitobacter sp. S190]
MRQLAAFLALALPLPALACGQMVCVVSPETLNLTEIITFDDTKSSFGPGHRVDEVLSEPGARFGERFVGQVLDGAPHDAVSGEAIGPLTLLAGAPGQNLSVVTFWGVSVLNGYGPAGYPRREAQGEGAIAVLFDRDQSALSLHIRGGEAGAARVRFLRRDGAMIADLSVSPLGEHSIGFLRAQAGADIAGLVITNTDPQGIALDTIQFGKPPDLS